MGSITKATCCCGNIYAGYDGYSYYCPCGTVMRWEGGTVRYGTGGLRFSIHQADGPSTLDTAKLEALSAVEPHKVYRTPDYVAPIVGWRAWRIDDGQLAGLGGYPAWVSGKPVAAQCGGSLSGGFYPVSHSGECPSPKCHCGYWAFADRDKLVAAVQGKYEVKVLGECYLWGRVIMSPNRKNPIGYRAQYAYPKELWLLDESLEYLGSTYNVPVRSLVR